jgi:hypothetical protein
MEELDNLAADGRVTNVSLARRHGGGWQCYLTLGATGSHIAQIDDSPSSALAKAIEKVPATEAYDMKYGAAAVSERAKDEQVAADRNSHWADFNAREAREVAIGLEPAEPTGVFD